MQFSGVVAQVEGNHAWVKPTGVSGCGACTAHPVVGTGSTSLGGGCSVVARLFEGWAASPNLCLAWNKDQVSVGETVWLQQRSPERLNRLFALGLGSLTLGVLFGAAVGNALGQDLGAVFGVFLGMSSAFWVVKARFRSNQNEVVWAAVRARKGT